MKWFVSTLVLALAFIVTLTIFLQPNSFIGCSDLPTDAGQCAPADAIVVVSGGDTQARTDAGIELYKNGWANALIFSGAAQDKTGPSNAEAMELQAVQAGVPHSAIFIDEEAASTRQNAENTQAIFDDRGYKNIILVTSGYHQRRASLEFNKLAENVEIRNYPVQDSDWGWFWWLSPRGWWLAGGEMVKIIAFYTGAVS